MARRLRTGSGRFRQTSLGDLGMSHCECCGSIFTPVMPTNPDADPCEFAAARKKCPKCHNAPMEGPIFGTKPDTTDDRS